MARSSRTGLLAVVSTVTGLLCVVVSPGAGRYGLGYLAVFNGLLFAYVAFRLRAAGN